MVKINIPLDLKRNPIKKTLSFNSDLTYARDLKMFLEDRTKKFLVDDGKKDRKEHHEFGYYMVDIERKENFHDKILVDVRTESDFNLCPIVDKNPTMVLFNLFLVVGENVIVVLISVKLDQTIIVETAHGINIVEFTKEEQQQIEDAVWLQLEKVDRENIEHTQSLVQSNIWDYLKGASGDGALDFLRRNLNEK